jgi:hypothetical protein
MIGPRSAALVAANLHRAELPPERPELIAKVDEEA